MITNATPTTWWLSLSLAALKIRNVRDLSCRFFVLFILFLGCGAQTSFAAGECNTPTFNSAPTFDAGDRAISVASGDLNGDGAMDAVTPNFVSGAVSILMGDGNGAFLPRVPYKVGVDTGQGSSPQDVAIADLNGDGKLDVIVVGGFAHGWIAVLLGDGAGNFAAPVTEDIGNGALTAIVIADFNGDNKKDVAAAQSSSRQILFKLGNGAGGFSASSTVPVTNEPHSIAAGDLNGDGLADVVSGNTYPFWSVAIVKGRSDGNFVPDTSITTRSQPQDVVFADFNSDGKLDLALAFGWADYGIELRFGDGAGGFGPAGQIFTAYLPTTLIAADVNNDNKPDVLFSSHDANGVGVLIGLGNEHFLLPQYFNTLPDGASALVAADFNGDGQKDLVASGNDAGRLSVLLGSGSGSFAAPHVIALVDRRGSNLATADFNGDGKADLAVTALGPNGVLIYLNDGAGGVSLPTLYPTSRNENSIVVADLNHDGKPDVVVGNENTSTISILLGDGTGGLSAAADLALGGSFLKSMVVGSFDGDNNPDLAIVNNDSVGIMHGTGSGSFGSPIYVGSAFGRIDTADINGDGKSDLAVRSLGGNSISVLLGDGAGGFSAASYSPLQIPGGFDYYFRLFDIDNSGLPDLVVSLPESSKVSLLTNNGAGFDAPAVIAGVTNPGGLVMADFNADGFADVAVTASEYLGNVVVLSGDGSGAFSAPNYFTVGGLASAIVTADFNGDNKPDLATPSHVGILLNTFQVLPCLSVSDASVTEGDAIVNANFTVTLSAPSAETVRVNYTVADGTAKAGNDYTPVSGRLAFAPGELTKTVSVPIIGDLSDEFDETFKILLSNPAAAAIGNGQGTGTIIDNDPVPILKVNDFTVTEGSLTNFQTFTVTLSAPGGKPVTVQYATSNGTAVAGTQENGDDYVSTNGTLTIPAGASSITVGVTVFGDDTFETNETLFLDLSNPTNATLEDAQGQLTITNDDPMPVITIEDRFVTEGDGVNALFTVSLSNRSYQDISVNYATADGSAIAGSDYLSTTGTLLINKGSLGGTIAVPLLNDNLIEPGETYFLNLSNPMNATIQRVQANGGIVDDDTPIFAFSSSVYFVSEGAGLATITVARTGGVNSPATVDFATSDGTATQRTRYTISVGTLNFGAGDTSKTFTVLITDGNNSEGTQNLNLTLSNPTGGAILGALRTARLVINDNDLGTPTTNPDDDAVFFVRQHYYDFLSRVPDQSGLDYWSGQISQCGTDQACLRAKRIDVSNAFFYEQEYQQTGSYVYRLYRAAYGNNQPLPNPFPNSQYPNEERKLPNYSAFAPDRARVRGGANLPQRQLDLANAFVSRAEFLAKYPADLTGPAFVDAVLATIKDDIGVDLTAQRAVIIDLLNQDGRGAVIYRLADDNLQTNPINNRAFIDAEYNRAFVATQYFGYLRRNPDIGGFIFWLGQVNSAALRDVAKQHAMVCSFITSTEYQQRFSSIVMHSNAECQ
ncbi:MAG TPA: FG-GAP-like repeat-containing protein [Pyrinomonadaceae bacterium]|nr:FG-GAP-like repeat-containing protein [Pyrinomonadaceae bacterium]